MERGRLKIYFGYSAGVGKTYAMLRAAKEAAAEGVDVVIGYLEPHARPETEAMAEGLDVVPPRLVRYKGMTLKEFDVDAALERRPALILVDELAHTNAPSSKNAKRYLDVEELINNGIDVYTTVNVQHIEGLHDVVDYATSVDVNERVPDEIFDFADEVALVDIEPNELVERMREGKIYSKTRAAAALENFFNADNLTSLRELSLRRGADRLEKRANNGTLRTKVLTLISTSPSADKNIRVAARTAEAYHCKFSAMYVETNGALGDTSAANLKRHMALVRDLGGEMLVEYGDDVVETVADYVKLAGVTHLIIGKSPRSVGVKAGLEDKFIARLPYIEVLIVPDNARGEGGDKYGVTRRLSRLLGGGKLLAKYKAANKIVDIADLIAQAAMRRDVPRNSALAQVLARAFERSAAIIDARGVAKAARDGDDAAVFDDVKERAVAEWCRTNGKPAGRGTDTLRDAKCAYFPLVGDKSTAAVALDCSQSKLRVTDVLIFYRIRNLLKAFVMARDYST